MGMHAYWRKSGVIKTDFQKHNLAKFTLANKKEKPNNFGKNKQHSLEFILCTQISVLLYLFL